MKGHSKTARSKQKNVQRSFWLTFREKPMNRIIVVLVGLFLLIILVKPLISQSPSDLRGAAPTPSFDFDALESDVFADIPGDHPHAYALSYLKSRGMIHGFEQDNTFRPDEMIDRAVFMKMLSESLHAYPHGLRYGHCFADVANEWFAPYVCYGVDQEWIEGGKEGSFSPADSLTRGVALKTLMRAYEVDVEDATNRASQYEDILSDSPFISYVVVAEQKGWLEGLVEGSSFEADTEMTRAEVAELLFRIALTELPNF